jgi:hypothetical protein
LTVRWPPPAWLQPSRRIPRCEPSADDIAIARLIGDVWLSNLVAWVTRRALADDVSSRLELAARLLLR